jgi:RNA polymerase sigma-70 factor (ECF subfamily)
VEQDEAALLARLATGEREEPLIALYQLYGRRLYGLGLRLLHDRASAEELVQETFVRIWRGAERYDPAIGSPRSWIFSIARRTAIDLHRRAAVRPQTASRRRGPDGRDDAPLDAIPADDELDSALTGMDVREALLDLSQDHREVLVLGYHQQLTQTEIAARLGIPLGTVKTRTYHALRAMRTQLEELRLL